MWDWLGKAADFASLASLLVSAYAAWQITAVRKKVSRQISFNLQADEFLPEVEKALTQVRGVLESDPVDFKEAELVIRRCIARIQRTRPAMTSDIVGVMRRLEKGERDYQKLRLQPSSDGLKDELTDRLWSLVQDIAIYVDGARDLIKERRLGGGDDGG